MEEKRRTVRNAVSIDDLSLGMYVSRLGETQPKLDTFRGVLIDNREDIGRLKAQTSHVYIDLNKSDKYAFLRLPETLDDSTAVATRRGKRKGVELVAYQRWLSSATRWFGGTVEEGFIYGET